MKKVALLLALVTFLSGRVFCQDMDTITVGESGQLKPSQKIQQLQQKLHRDQQSGQAQTDPCTKADIEYIQRKLKELQSQNSALQSQNSALKGEVRNLARNVAEIGPVKKDVGKINDTLYGPPDKKGKRSGGIVATVNDPKRGVKALDFTVYGDDNTNGLVDDVNNHGEALYGKDGKHGLVKTVADQGKALGDKADKADLETKANASDLEGKASSSLVMIIGGVLGLTVVYTLWRMAALGRKLREVLRTLAGKSSAGVPATPGGASFTMPSTPAPAAVAPAPASPAPFILSATPRQVAQASSSPISFEALGRNFKSADVRFRMSGETTQFATGVSTSASGDKVSGTLPTSFPAAGMWTMCVINDDGQEATFELEVTAVAPTPGGSAPAPAPTYNPFGVPVINKMTPDNGDIAGGIPFEIEGEFTASGTSVVFEEDDTGTRFDPTELIVTDHLIRGKTPALTGTSGTGSYHVIVTTAGGNASIKFTYT